MIMEHLILAEISEVHVGGRNGPLSTSIVDEKNLICLELGKLDIGVCNLAGEDLLQFCEINQLSIMLFLERDIMIAA